MPEAPTYPVKLYQRPFSPTPCPDRLTAAEIHTYVQLASHCQNYNWGISLAELDRVTSEPDFPVHFMIDIRCAILFCLANTMVGSGMLDETEFAIASHCFTALAQNESRPAEAKNSPPGDQASNLSTPDSHLRITDDTPIRARRRFLQVYLDDLTNNYLWKCYGNGVSLCRSEHYPSGDVFVKFHKNWQGTVMEQYLHASLVDFQTLRQDLTTDFSHKLKDVMSTSEYRQSHSLQLLRDTKSVNRLILAQLYRKQLEEKDEA